ncbi:MAG: hypothetical protein ABI880_13410 [Acidobacteriota bacterium]
MPQECKVRSRALLLAIVAVVGLRVAPAAAQATDDGPRRVGVPAPPPSDFMLGRPRVYLGVDSGFLFANTGSDLYDFITEQLTLDKKSFNTPVLGARLGVSLNPRIDVIGGFDLARSQSGSEYRNLVDNQLLPISQNTSRREFNLTGSVRLNVLPSGRRISRFAWIPRTFTPYVGAGAGALKYQFEQTGSFVDFETLRVFNDTFVSEGWAPSAHAFAGADLRVYRRIYLSLEGRYTWSTARLGTDFVDFDPISLAGVRLGGGLRIAF